MTNSDIALHRAKIKDDNVFVVGSLLIDPKYGPLIVSHLTTDLHGNDVSVKAFKIEPNSLAISLPNMIDSGSNRIFASTSKNGKGGDIVKYKYYKQEYTVVFAKDMEQPLALNLQDEYDTGWRINPRLKIKGIKK